MRSNLLRKEKVWRFDPGGNTSIKTAAWWMRCFPCGDFPPRSQTLMAVRGNDAACRDDSWDWKRVDGLNGWGWPASWLRWVARRRESFTFWWPAAIGWRGGKWQTVIGWKGKGAEELQETDCGSAGVCRELCLPGWTSAKPHFSSALVPKVMSTNPLKQWVGGGSECSLHPPLAGSNNTNDSAHGSVVNQWRVQQKKAAT